MQRRSPVSLPPLARRVAPAALALALTAAAAASDWTSWRGPFDNGMAPENAVVTDFSPETGTGVLWQQDFGGRNTPLVHAGRVYFNCPVGSDTGRGERMVCLDAASGEIVWQQRFNVFHTDIVENRVGWTSAVVDPETGNVYCHGTGGELFCWDRDGQQLWKRSLTEEFGRVSGYGGRLMTPIIDEDRVVISFLSASWGPHAKGMHRYFALDKRTGEVAWISTMPGDPLDTTYATPVAGVVNGRRQLICPAADGWVYGLAARSGEIIWRYQLSKRGLNVSPVLDGNRVYVAHSEENFTTTEMGAVLCIDASRSGDITDGGALWRLDGMAVGYCSPALAGGRLYVVTNNANMYAIDASDGRVIWEHGVGRVGKGSPVVTADGVIYYGEQNGIFSICKDEGDRCVTLSQHEFEGPDHAVDEIFGPPAVVGGRVYLVTRYRTLCLGSADAEVARFEVSRPGSEADPAQPALLRPAEVSLYPGESIDFTVSGADGADWQALGVAGTLDADGRFTAAADAGYSAGVVQCRAGEQTLTARVRVTPRLPIELDFSQWPEGAPPPGWLACGGGPATKLAPYDLDGERVLRKVTSRERPSPPFMRLQTYVTPPIEAGYTVQCDMLSRSKQIGRVTYLPDMGLVNARYVFIMQGSTRRETRSGTRGAPSFLRIQSWGDLPRIREDVAFEWQPDTWYTMKFEVVPQGDAAVARGKIWPRGEQEPPGWQVEVVDRYPNLEGSAGLYAYSTGTQHTEDGPETYFDNLRIYRDE